MSLALSFGTSLAAACATALCSSAFHSGKLSKAEFEELSSSASRTDLSRTVSVPLPNGASLSVALTCAKSASLHSTGVAKPAGNEAGRIAGHSAAWVRSRSLSQFKFHIGSQLAIALEENLRTEHSTGERDARVDDFKRTREHARDAGK